jgi:hypothetical protein
MVRFSEQRRIQLETALVCAFVVWSALTYSASIRPFAELLEGLGATLPSLSKLALQTSRQVVSLSIAALLVLALVTKEFLQVTLGARHRANVIVFVAVAVGSTFLHVFATIPFGSLLINIK